jgi:hypothetical protein
MKLRRTIKPNLKSPKKFWKPKEFLLENICMPLVPKEDRPMIIWSQNYPFFSDTICLDYDDLTPAEFMCNLMLSNKLEFDSIVKCVMVVMESSGGHVHVVVKVDNKLIRPTNYKKVYRQIAEKLGSNYDSKCCDPFRGFFYPNRIVYQNFDCESYVYEPSKFICFNSSKPNILKNIVSREDSNSEIGEFVIGNRNNFIFRTLLKMVKERGDVGCWMEEFAYNYVQDDFTKDEIDRIIEYFRKTDRKFKRIKFLGQIKKNKYEERFGKYKQLRMEGKTHQEACMEVLSDMSVKTQQKYRSNYNKEFGINEMRGGKIGRTWKCEKKETKNNTITKESV